MMQKDKKIEIKVNKRFYILHNQAEVQTPQNCQTQWNASLATADEFFECV